MPGTMSIGGIASGLKTDEIIAKIMDLARQPQQKLQAQQEDAKTKLTAWQDLNTRVLALKMKSDAVASDSSFSQMLVTSSDTGVLTASASSTATPGTYYIKVTQIAQAHQVGSQAGAYSSVNDAVGTGTVSIALNNGTSFSVTLDSNNNTLSGLRDAINKANGGAHADLVNAGTTTAPDYRLLLTSTATGVEAGMSAVTVNLTGGTVPVFDLDNPVQQAQNAKLEIGGGTGGSPIVIEKSTNTINDVIPGVTLNVRDYDTTQTIRLDVNVDVATLKANIQGVVDQYNSLSDAIDELTAYDSTSGSSGVLLGDYQLQSVQMNIESALGAIVEGLAGSYSSLSTLGITQDMGGHLSIDDAELTDALTNHLDQVRKVFTANLETDSSYVSYVTSTPDTRPSGTAGWAVEVTQAARRAQVTAGAEMGSPLNVDEALTVNGTTIALTSGMTLDDVISKINGYSSTTGITALKTGADGTGSGNYLTFRRIQYGSRYDMSILSSISRTAGATTGVGNMLISAADPQGEGDLGQSMLGLDVAGTINGEAATGSGQALSLNSDDSTNDAKGISLMITSPTTLSGVNIKFTKGVGVSLRDLLVNMTSTTGAITTAQDGIETYIADLDDRIADMESQYAVQQDRLYSQFNAMEAQLSKLQSQGQYLSQQLGALSNNSK